MPRGAPPRVGTIGDDIRPVFRLTINRDVRERHHSNPVDPEALASSLDRTALSATSLPQPAQQGGMTQALLGDAKLL